MSEILSALKIMSLNAENLFLLSDQELTPDHLKLNETQWQKLSTSVFNNKPLEKAKSLAQIILEQAPDILILSEVGGFESLKNFNRLFLRELYSPALIEGNSDRNIDVGYLVKKTTSYYFDLISNRNRPIGFLYPHERENLDDPTSGKIQSHKFSRDVAELHLFKSDREKPFFVFLATHLKSRLDPNGFDPQGAQRREAELRTLIEIYQELETKFSGQVPIVIAGDFNGNASKFNTDPEFLPIYKNTKLRDIGDLAAIPQDKAHTYYQVGRNSKSEGKQLDYCFLSEQAQKLLNSPSVLFYRYKDHMGLEFDPPTTLDAKLQLPSDHYPLLFTLNDVPLS
jgi:exonuclease III